MVTLYRRPESTLADEIQDALEELCVARTVVIVTDAADLPTGADRADADRADADRADADRAVDDCPLLVEGDDVIRGDTALRAYVDDLRRLMTDWLRFQSDTCELDRDGTVC